MIDKVSKSERQTYDKLADGCRAHEYLFNSEEINSAVIELTGRYPKEGWAVNTACTSLIYVIRGRGQLRTPQEVTDFETGDQLLIPKGQPYAFKAEAEILFSAAPAWTPDQAKVIKD